MNKVAIVGAAVVIIVALVAAVYLLQPQSFEPIKFQYFGVNGNPNGGTYSFTFSLSDKNNNNGATGGTVSLRIEDSFGKVLYGENLTLKESDFTKVLTNATAGNEATGYVWSIPALDLNAGVPDPSGGGLAVIDFTTMQGNTFAAIDTSVKIPALPNGTTIPQCAYFFYSNSCIVCQMAKTYLAQVQQDYPLLTIQQYEISNSSNYNMMVQYFNCHGVYNTSDYIWPVVFIGNDTLSGYGEIYGWLNESLAENTGTACPVCDLVN